MKTTFEFSTLSAIVISILFIILFALCALSLALFVKMEAVKIWLENRQFKRPRLPEIVTADRDYTTLM
jgi:uncharacterized membrane protein YciS (DUF1049 family)